MEALLAFVLFVILLGLLMSAGLTRRRPAVVSFEEPTNPRPPPSVR